MCRIHYYFHYYLFFCLSLSYNMRGKRAMLSCPISYNNTLQHLFIVLLSFIMNFIVPKHHSKHGVYIRYLIQISKNHSSRKKNERILIQLKFTNCPEYVSTNTCVLLTQLKDRSATKSCNSLIHTML